MAASRGAVVSLGGQMARALLQVVGIVVLARLLSPEDYGVVAIVAVIVGIGELFRDFGLSTAAVQASTLSRAERDNLFWLNSGIGVVLAALLCAAAPLIAAAFDDPRLTAVAMALSVTFVLNGLSTQHRAMHVRSLRFGVLVSTEAAGQAVGVAVGISLALLGHGYWALVALQLVQGAVTLLLLAAGGRWLPGGIDRGATIRPFVGYGLPLLGAQVLNLAGTSAATLTIGARFGTAPVGLFDRASQLVRLLLLQLQAPSTRVAVPVLSRLQSQPRRFSDFVSYGQVVLLTLIAVMFALLVAQAPSVVHIVLGDQWADVVPLLRVLLIAGFFQSAAYAVYWVFLARGLTRSQLRYALVTRPAMVLLVIAGSSWGVQGVAVAYAVAAACAWPVALWWIRRAVEGLSGRLFGNGVRAGVLLALAATGSHLAVLPIPADAHLLRLLVGSAGVLAVVVALGLLWPAFRRDLGAIAALRGTVRSARGGGTTTEPVDPRPPAPRVEVES
ncbi:lipopolysaccharide biosynthesis protein [Blastococcus sp. KM273129]|uniref:lipopolysaccharide biosynthesis protein n=1 Tax=Blastococcus sp. KM273129 TaxID=2570315 RepID=UPI001F1D4529|nr:lipopolysaccharide biosynthesis protein [Blastococcus sp. KM273129]MCF6736934.1 lipopolysaccharide biosynthesis protein [Blastococcus sp. KM273129]